MITALTPLAATTSTPAVAVATTPAPAPVAATAPAPVAVVVERARELIASVPATAAYRAALAAALSLPGNILSDAPDTRWARLVWTSCTAAGGRWGEAVPMAVAAELFMVALDLLDDAEDDETSPLHHELGAACTLNVSTGLLFLAQRELLDAPGRGAARMLLDAGLRACDGQHADLTGTAAQCPDLDHALSVTAGKSASLTAELCRLGALRAGADTRLRDSYAEYGYCLGIVAQLTNDLVGIGPDAAGKTDEALDRPTLPLAFRALYAQPAMEPAGDGRSDGQLAARGAAYFTWIVADAYRRRALALIPSLAATDGGRADLAALLDVW